MKWDDAKLKFISGLPAGVKTIVHMNATNLTVGIIKPAESNAQTTVSWDTLSSTIIASASLAGQVNKMHWGFVVDNVPGEDVGATFEYLGCVTISLDGLHGEDEFADLSLLTIDIDTSSYEPLCWSNATMQNYISKNAYQARRRGSLNIINAAYIWIPTSNPTDFTSETRVLVVGNKDGSPPITLGDTPAISFDENAVSNMSYGNTFFWKPDVVTAPGSIAAGATATVEIQLKENSNFSNFSYATTLVLEEVSGYAPKKRVETDANGFASFKVSALGLEAGDKLIVKINSTHYSALEKVIIDVV